MKGTKNNQKGTKYQKMVIIFGIIAGICIIFSFLAPIIFTGNSSKWNFSETGQIGDTIGGIMNPFISIAGVISTFMAFLMQVRANEIQREQFLKSMSLNFTTQLIDSLYKTQILYLDIKRISQDLIQRKSNLEMYYSNLKEHPFIFSPLLRTPLNLYRQIDLDKVSLYNGFKYLSKDKPEEFIRPFNEVFNLIDYTYECFQSIYQIVDNHELEIFKIKKYIKEQLTIIFTRCEKLVNSSYGDPSFPYTAYIKINGLKENYLSVLFQTKDDIFFEKIQPYLVEFITKDKDDEIVTNEDYVYVYRKSVEVVSLLYTISEKVEQVTKTIQNHINEIYYNDKTKKQTIDLRLKAIEEFLSKEDIEKEIKKIREELEIERI